MKKRECPICGYKSLVDRKGDYNFQPPPNIQMDVIIIKDAEWEECLECKEILLPPKLIASLEDYRYKKLIEKMKEKEKGTND